MTPTEAAALGAFLSLAFALAYGRLTYKVLRDSALTAVKISAMAGFLFFTTRVYGQVFQHLGISEVFYSVVVGLPFNRFGVLAIIYLMYVVMGMFLDDWSTLLITLPFILPVITGLGFSPIWFGVFYVMVEAIALVSPPFGFHLYVLQSAIGKHDAMKIAMSALPFMIPLVIMAILLTIFPELVLWLPSVLF